MVGEPMKGLDSWDCGDHPDPFPRASIRIIGEIGSKKIS